MQGRTGASNALLLNVLTPSRLYRGLQEVYRPTMGRSRRTIANQGAAWRLNVLSAKSTAWQTLAPLVKLQVRGRANANGQAMAEGWGRNTSGCVQGQALGAKGEAGGIGPLFDLMSF